jgi:hypothetical protein
MKTFKEFINEGSEKYEIKDGKFGSKKTKILKLKEIKDSIFKDFTNTSKEVYKMNKSYESQGSSWTIFIDKQTNSIWGVSGDYWFGKAPSYLNNKYGGNIKAAEEVYKLFLKDIGEY